MLPIVMSPIVHGKNHSPWDMPVRPSFAILLVLFLLVATSSIFAAGQGQAGQKDADKPTADSSTSSTGSSAGLVADEKPRVLILGDSISLGYTPIVRQLLHDEAVVVRAMRNETAAENCAGTTHGVKNIERWMKQGDGHWDVIHFNFGLHDLKRVNRETGKSSLNPDDPQQADLETYERQLREIVEKLKTSGAKLIFATTTPVPPGGVRPYRDVDDPARFNKVARKIMRKEGVSIDDLYAFALPRLGEIQAPVNVHFTKAGSRMLGELVASHIRAALANGQEKVLATRRPNIIFFLSDDQRSDLLGCAGHPILQTPHIDQLARQGVRFENMFVTTSICAASRATILTGLVERSHRFTFGTPPISEEHCLDSYPHVLREAGYHTGFIGKFGVSVTGGESMTSAMFDYFRPLSRNPYFKKQADGSQRHVSEIAGDLAIDFLKQQTGDAPFCLSVSFNAPHAEDGDKENQYPWPHAVDGLYDGVVIPPPHLAEEEVFDNHPKFMQESMNRDRWFWRWDTPEKYQKNIRAYFRMISGVDHVVGRVMAELEKLGIDNNTVIVFAGDNGYYLGSRGFAGKWSHFEESLRVPLVIRDPRMPEKLQGRVLSPIVLNLDLAPTFVSFAGLAPPANYQGQSLVPWLNGTMGNDTTKSNTVTNANRASHPTGKQWREDFFCEHLFDNSDIPKWEGVRGQRYVYARYFQQVPVYEYLHDLEKDPQQLINFVDDPGYAEILQQMRTRCDELREEYGGEYSLEKFPTQKWLRQKKVQQKQAP